MPDYKALYFGLLAAASDAVVALDRLNLGQAREILIRAQQWAEDAVRKEGAKEGTDA